MTNKCAIPQCTQPMKYKGLCGKHYKREWRHGNANKTLIKMHEGEKCSVPACEQTASKRTYCKLHYTRWFRYGRTHNIIAAKGEGRPKTTAGYILLTLNGRRVYEHVAIMEALLNGPLPEGAVVHHRNGVKDDNRPENLELIKSHSEHITRYHGGSR